MEVPAAHGLGMGELEGAQLRISIGQPGHGVGEPLVPVLLGGVKDATALNVTEQLVANLIGGCLVRTQSGASLLFEGGLAPSERQLGCPG